MYFIKDRFYYLCILYITNTFLIIFYIFFTFVCVCVKYIYKYTL